MFRERIDSYDRLQSRNRFLFKTIFPTMLLTLVLTFYVFSTELLFTINSPSTATDVTVEPSFPPPPPPPSPSPSPSPSTSTPSSDEEKFLTYLPHSGFHNQRISLVNAIILSHLTNRTLIIPPILINHKIPYDSFNNLYKVLNETVSIKRYRMYHCDEIENQVETCNKSYSKYDNFTMANWDDILDLSLAKKYIKIVHRGYDFSLNTLNENFNVSDQETYLSIEKKHYQFRFYDNDESIKGLDKFEEQIFISELLKIDKKLLHFSSLFSSYRIVLEKEENIRFNHMIHKSLMINNHRILNLSNQIIKKLGGNGTYFGLHIRVGDAVFKNQEQIALSHIRNNLTTTFSDLGLNKKKIDTNNLGVCLKNDLPIIYVATDSKDPKKEFKELYEEYSCVFTLYDFTKELSDMSKMPSDFDENIDLKDFYIPLIDLLISALGRFFFGTENSTFSKSASEVHDVYIGNNH